MNKLSLLLISTIIILSSCAPVRTIVDTSCPGYKNIDFNRSKISEKGIGIMPVLGGSKKEQYRRPMGDAITKYFRVEFGEDKVKSTNQVITILNNEDLVEKYTRAINDYNISGIIPKKLVIELGEALGVDYLLYTRLLADNEVSIVTVGSTSRIISVDEIYVQCQVWDTKIGDIVWEGKGGIAKLDQNNSDVIEKTAEGLSKVVGNDKNDGPCETKDVLRLATQSANSNTYTILVGIPLLISLMILLF